MNTEDKQIAQIGQVVAQSETDFNRLATIHGAVSFQKEASFALQILKANSYLMQVAMGDPDSLKTAILNVAAIGLSLNPIKKLAYLIPRKKKVCLDLSYLGLVQLALDAGAIQWAQAELVCEKDKFKLGAPGKAPTHNFDPFKKRGAILGGFCVAKTGSGEFITAWMTLADIYSVRDRSESWKAFKRDSSKAGPWNTDESEMMKKTLIRRASKSWPMTDTRQKERIERAIDVTEDYSAEPAQSAVALLSETEVLGKFDEIRSMLQELNRSEEKYVDHLVKIFKRDIKRIEDLTDMELEQSKIMLEGFLKTVREKELRNENADGN